MHVVSFMSLWIFFQPTKEKVGVALITSFLYTAARTFLPVIFSGNRNNIGLFTPLTWIFNVLFLGILVYPFACSLVTLYNNRGNLSEMDNKILVIIGLLVFNPVIIEAILLYVLVFILTH